MKTSVLSTGLKVDFGAWVSDKNSGERWLHHKLSINLHSNYYWLEVEEERDGLHHYRPSHSLFVTSGGEASGKAFM